MTFITNLFKGPTELCTVKWCLCGDGYRMDFFPIQCYPKKGENHCLCEVGRGSETRIQPLDLDDKEIFGSSYQLYS